MIPLRLTLKNFMSYGDPPVTIPFEGLHVACLSGDNGNGKSAILDGITWALWARTRASSVRAVSEDDLIRLGSDEMEVRFEFALNGQRYRVIKKRKRGKSAGSDWQLAMCDAAGGWAPIGGNSQREVGRQIIQLLSMEYETFLNSAYLQQGRVDEFTRQTPDNRKRILGEILGLGRYDRLEEKARERQKERKERVEDLERDIRVLEGQIGQLPEHLTRLADTRARVADCQVRLEDCEAEAGRLRAERVRLDALAEQAAQQEVALQRLRAEATALDAERSTRIARIDGLRSVLEQKDAILADYAGLKRATQRREALEPLVEAFNRAGAELRSVIGVIDIAEKELRGEIRLIENKVANVERRVQERERIDRQAVELERELLGEPDQEGLLAGAFSVHQARLQEFSDLSAKNRELTAAIDDLSDVIELLQRPRAICPVCESDLSADKRERTLARQLDRHNALVAQQREVQQGGRAKKQELNAAQETMAEQTRLRDAQVARRQRLADLRAQLATLGEPVAEHAALCKAHLALVKQLETGDFAAPQRAQRIRLQAEADRLGAVKAEYEVVRQQIQRLEPARRRQQELQQAESGLDRECEELERLERALEKTATARSEAEARLSTQHSWLARHSAVVAAADHAEADLRRLQTEINALHVSEGSLTRYIAEAERAEEDRRAREAQKRQAEEERRMYNALVKAFGKSGVQTLIIENAIPEIADEANSLLARMTDNAMQVSFETVRAAKQGGHEIETLDIRIADDAGVRPYELFSGGEAFRINFAIRIALSRLLARRSGARLQTLFMDEGFGSQDGKGREKLVEVIEAIKDDFEKILVITHIEELKDAFAQRIEVTKDANGSHVHLL